MGSIIQGLIVWCMLLRARYGLCIARWLTVLVMDPMEIIKGNSGAELVEEGKAIELLGTDDLFVVLRRTSMYISVIVILVLLISMLFIRRSDKLGERKDDILHKLSIVFLIASLIALLNIVSSAVEGVFA